MVVIVVLISEITQITEDETNKMLLTKKLFESTLIHFSEQV